MKKFNIEDYLHSIDKKFQDKTKKDIYMIYIMIFAAIFAFSYLLFWDTSFAMFEKKLKQTEQIKQKIAADKLFLKLNPPSVIVALDTNKKNTEAKLIEFRDYNQYIKSKIDAISFLIYNERIWGDFIDSIDTKAKRYGVKILELSNTYNYTGESFGHVLDISINTNGEYKNLLKFINSLEQSNLVVDVHDLNISARDYLEGKVNISVWGIMY